MKKEKMNKSKDTNLLTSYASTTIKQSSNTSKVTNFKAPDCLSLYRASYI
jgi:hypothetical protein